MDENMESIFPIAQNIIRAASNNDTVPLLRQLQNNVLLDAPKKIVGGHPPHHTGRPAAAEHSVGQAAPTGSKLSALLNKLRGKSGLIGHLFDQFLVIIFPAQTVRQLLCNASASAAKLSAYGNNPFIHLRFPPSGYLFNLPASH